MDELSGGADWGPEQVIRASALETLLRDGTGDIGTRGMLRLIGVRISGVLDLAGAKIANLVEFTQCWFDEKSSFGTP